MKFINERILRQSNLSQKLIEFFNRNNLNKLNWDTVKVEGDFLGFIKKILNITTGSYEFDDKCNLISMSTKFTKENYIFKYNELGQKESETNVDNNMTKRFLYDKNGDIVSISIDGFDLPNRPAYIFIYDRNRNLIKKKDMVGNTFEYIYDDHCRIIEEFLPNNETIKYSYRPELNMIMRYKSNDYSEILIHDSIGRITNKKYFINSMFDIKYNDILNQLITYPTDHIKEEKYGYDEHGNLTYIVTPDVFEFFEYSYKDNILESITKNGKELLRII